MMGNRAVQIRQADLTRYAKAMQAAGVEEWRVVAHPDGRQEVIVGHKNGASSGPNPDELLE